MSKEKTPIEDIISMLEDVKTEQLDVDTLIFKISLYKEDFREAIEEAYDGGHDDSQDEYYNPQYYTDKYGK